MEKLNDTSRAEFEAFMADRFKDSIDRRRCKNGDGNDYMSWDMNVARVVWQHMSQRAEAAEADFRESEKTKQELFIARDKLLTANLSAGKRINELEAKLAELEKQRTVGNGLMEHLEKCSEIVSRWPEWKKKGSDAAKFIQTLDDFETGYLNGHIEACKNRPAPAADLAELVPDEKPKPERGANLSAFTHWHDGWNSCRAAIMRNIEESK